MLEILGEKVASELRRIPDNETVVARAPRHDRIRRRIVHHIIGLAQERGRSVRDRIRVRIRNPISLSTIHINPLEIRGRASIRSRENERGTDSKEILVEIVVREGDKISENIDGMREAFEREG